MLKIGSIGDKNHADRMIKIVNGFSNAHVDVVYHPKRVPITEGGTSCFSDLLNCDAVFILSPNSTHFPYMEQLREANYKGYILCEKPPISDIKHLKKLKEYDSEKIYFNYNFRFCKWSEIIETAIKNGYLGKIIHISVIWTHGLAYKNIYKNSWRADRNQHLHGVLETVATHPIDLIGKFLGNVVDYTYSPSIVANSGTAFDTCHLTTRYEKEVTASILASYAAPLDLSMTIVGSNGILEARKGKVTINSPRDTFNKEGLFSRPPKVLEESINDDEMYLESLKDSVSYFLSHCSKKEPFPSIFFDRSFETNKIVLEIGKNQ
jgi:predicted dehydrogenase